ncbi:MAG: Propanediol utilization diol dehydratase, small subunit [Chloroflexota bacterium]|jgi:propanediol dehydratase small subunit
MPNYPLYTNHADTLVAASGRPLAEVTVDAATLGDISLDDMQITQQSLRAQAEIARNAGYTQLAQNLERAAELTVVPRDEIITMYHVLRPGRSDFAELMALATRLEQQYQAVICAQFVREAATVYQQRGMLRHPDAL